MHVYMFIHVHSPMHAHVEVRGQGVLVYFSPPYSSRQSLTRPEAPHILLEGLVSKPPISASLSPSTGRTHACCHTQSYAGTRNLLLIFAQQASYPMSVLNPMNMQRFKIHSFSESTKLEKLKYYTYLSFWELNYLCLFLNQFPNTIEV